MVLDINKVCRLCLEISSNSIFYPGNSTGHQNVLNEDLVRRIFDCTAVKVAAGDGLPESVCDACVGLINKFVLFRKMCWEVDDKLRQYFFNQKDAKEQLSGSAKPVRLDPDQIERPCEAKDTWMCGSSNIKGELDESDEDATNDNDGNDESDEECTPSSRDSSPKYSCNMCTESFHRLSGLKTHKEEEHPKAKKSKPIMTCHYCNKSFKQMKRYNDHMASHENSEKGTPEEEEKRPRRHAASENDSESQDGRLKSEVKNEIDDENSENQATGSEPGSNSKKRKFRKIYDCEYCDQVFHSHAKYTQHELTHTGEKKYNCSDCSRSFTHKHSLIGHIKEQHTGEVNFTCDVCGRGFVHQSTFIIHKKTHSTEKPLKCPECDKCFTQMKNLRVHRQIHSASRSHTCQVCGKSFNFMKTLKVHLVLHSGEKPYVCTYCGKAFAQSAPLKTHTRIHTGEKPYQCSICPSRFSTNNALKTHVLKHSGEAPYCCEVCHKGFGRKKDMVAHQEEMHDVFIGLPGQNKLQPPSTQQESSLTPQPNCPPPLHPLPSSILHTHLVSTHPSPSTHNIPSHHHSHVPHHIAPQLHVIPHHPPTRLPLPPTCMPHPAHFTPAQPRTEMPGTDCSGG